MSADMDKLEAIAKAATPGPWEAFTDCPGECCWLIRTVERESDITYPGDLIAAPEMSQEDAAYMATFCPERVLALLAVVRAAKNTRDQFLGSSIELQGLALSSLRTALAALDALEQPQ